MLGTGIFIAALLVALFCGVAATGAADFATLPFEQKLKLALAGDRKAQAAPGLAYEKGTQTKVDKLEAAKWYRMMADWGSIDAQFKLARIVSEDLPGLKKNSAIQWYRKASASNSAHAGGSAISAIDKAKSITIEADLSSPPLPPRTPKCLARKSLTPRRSK